MASIFRTDPATGLKIEKASENLIKWNLIAAFATLAVGGLLGLSVVLTRWPSVHLLPLDYYYRFLTLHGIDALLAWIIFFAIALVHFTSSALLGPRSYVPWLRRASLPPLLAGRGRLTAF